MDSWRKEEEEKSTETADGFDFELAVTHPFVVENDEGENFDR